MAEVNNKECNRHKKPANGEKKGKLRNFLLDALMVLLCLSGAAAGLNLFRLDMFRTISSKDERKPIGTITIRNNNVQRRLGDRVLWGRLLVESPLYLEDLVRVADYSGATMDIESTHIELEENTLIRVERPQEEDGMIQIVLTQGGMDVVTGSDSSTIIINIKGSKVQVGQETVLNAKAGENGLILQVSQGTATIMEEVEEKEQIRELNAGAMIALDAEGIERIEPAVVMIYPRSNARFLKNSPEAMSVNFAWNRVNMELNDTLSLEIASDRNFRQIYKVIETIGDSVETSIDSGIWNWRLSHNASVLSSGQITIKDASGPVLINPVNDRLFSYQTRAPQLRFQWNGIDDASHYILEVSNTPDFSNPRIKEQTATSFFVDSSLGPGTWYWHVLPVFPSAYNGTAAYSSTASFRIEQSQIIEEPVWPEPVVAAVPEPEPPVEEPPPVRIAAQPPVQAPPPAPPPEPPQILPFPAPADLSPESGHIFGIEELWAKRYIEFKWSQVPEANAYVFSLYEQSPGGRRQILNITVEESTSWTLNDISILDRGIFIWQVEAITRNRNGTIERRGSIGENAFILDIPLPNQPSVQIE